MYFMRFRGRIQDLGFALFLLVALVFVGFFSLKISNDFNQQYNNTVNNSNASTFPISSNETSILNNSNAAIRVYVGAIPVIYILTLLAAVITSYFIKTNPAFLPISLIIWLFFILESTIFSNILYEFLSNSLISPFANQFPLIVAIVRNNPVLIAVFGALLMIALYFRGGNNQTGEL